MTIATFTHNANVSSYFFGYGISVGIFLALTVYLSTFSLFQLVWHKDYRNSKLLFYGALSAVFFGLSNIYFISAHFAEINQILPEFLVFMGKISAPIGTFFIFQMFINSVPLRTATAFSFWYKTKSWYPLFYAIWIALFLGILLHESQSTALSLAIVGILVDLIYCTMFIFSALYVLPLIKLYGYALAVSIGIFVIFFSLTVFNQLTRLPSQFLFITHIVMSFWVVLYSFILTRYIVDERLPLAKISQSKLSQFYRYFYQALHHDELFLEYQPKINLQDGRVCGIEALVRWQHPKNGQVSPDYFVPLAEQTDMIDCLCEWVIEQVLKDIAVLRHHQLNIPVAINFSVKNIHPKMVVFLIEAIKKHGVSIDMITVEITESLFLHLNAEQKTALSMIHDAGIKLSLDDFGAGYSSLKHLDEMGLYEVKIDRSLTKKVLDIRKSTIVKTIMDMCHSLGINIVAEGVNDAATCQMLKTMQCNMIQGYYISKPKKLAELTDWISQAKHAI